MNEIIKLFLKLGTIGFGGPIALIGFMEEECVKQKKWLSLESFHRIVAVCKLFPGPLATLIAVRIGRERNGIAGGIAAGAALILPAFFMILILAKLATSLSGMAVLDPFWLGLSLAALAVAFQATLNLTRPVFKEKKLSVTQLTFILVISGILTFLFPRYEAAFILASGFLGIFLKNFRFQSRPRDVASLSILVVLFLGCFRASLFTFGSGIAIVPVLRTLFIDEYSLVTHADFLKGLTLAQITPGPLIILSTYLGYTSQGLMGAIITTLGTFLPAFIFGIYVIPKVEAKVLSSDRFRTFFDWLLPAVCGAIFGSLFRLAQMSIQNDGEFYWGRIALLSALLFIQFRFKLTPAKVFLIGGPIAYFIT